MLGVDVSKEAVRRGAMGRESRTVKGTWSVDRARRGSLSSLMVKEPWPPGGRREDDVDDDVEEASGRRPAVEDE